jgi:hypothetical protein
MNALIGTRKASIFLRLAIVLALTTITGSVARNPRAPDLSANARICFVIDGQIYCIP